MGFWPKDNILSFSHFGLSVFFIPLIKQLPNEVHPWFFSFVIFTLIFCGPENLILCNFFCLSLPAPAAAKSLATPFTPRQSALLGVIERSRTLGPLFLKYFFPIWFLYFLAFKSIIP